MIQKSSGGSATNLYNTYIFIAIIIYNKKCISVSLLSVEAKFKLVHLPIKYFPSWTSGRFCSKNQNTNVFFVNI